MLHVRRRVKELTHSSKPLIFPRGTHVPALDGLRGLAIVLVLVEHIWHGLRPANDVEDVVNALGRTGWSGVDLFFVLSGFLITGILYDAKGGPHYFRNFFVRRSLRIFPLYFGVLAAALAIPPLLAHVGIGPFVELVRSPDYATLQENQEWYWSYLTNVLIAREGYAATPLHTAHFWSLAVEEQFYLVWPAVVFLLGRRALVNSCYALILTSVVFRAGILALDLNGEAAYTLTPARLDSLCFGALIALKAREPGGWERLARAAAPTLAVCAALLVAVFLWRGGLRRQDDLVRIAGHTLLAYLFAALLIRTIATPGRSVAARLFERPVLRMFGRYSYGLYVYHFPIIYVLNGVVDPTTLPAVLGSRLPAFLLYGAAVVVASLAVSWVSWVAYEKHFLKLKFRFPNPVAHQPHGTGIGQAGAGPALPPSDARRATAVGRR
jgi:peptidoglycan/LPS O-acetylase OafA/YrhL